MHLGDGRGRSTAFNDNQLKDKNDGVVHGALLLGLVSGLVASRLPGLTQKKTQKAKKCISSKTGPGTQLAGIQVAANLYLNVTFSYLGSLSKTLCSWYGCCCDSHSWQGEGLFYINKTIKDGDIAP